MDASHWLVNGSLNAALHARAFDAARVMDALAGSSAVEQAMKSAASGLMLDHQSIVARATLHSGGYNELSAIAAEHMRALDGVVAANRAVTNAIHAATLHSALFEATNALQGAVTWRQMQQSIVGLAASQNVMLWHDINRLVNTSGVEAYALHQLSRIRDFDRALSGIIPAPDGTVWSTHLRAGALPALSFLAQDWSRPLPPACPTCAATESQDPGFLYRALCELTRPRFAVIRGGRQGDGRPRGRLHLVRDDGDQGE
jgi:hypothetical protein